MRRRTPERSAGQRMGCAGALVGLVLGLPIAYVAYAQTGVDAVIVLVLLLAPMLGAQVGQWLGHRRPSGRHRR